MPRDLGGLAEAQLRLWAKEAGAAVNPAFEDKKGWDFLVEFPNDIPSFYASLDDRPPEVSCLIQVKGTECKSSRRSIKLSNWERLVKHPLPAFFLILEYEETNSVDATYLVHVGKELIQKVLKRLREESLAQHEEISRKTMTLKWNKEHRIPYPDGEKLKEAIFQYVGEDLHSYVSTKIKMLKELGDVTPAIVSFDLTAANHEELLTQWIDLAIGLLDSIDVTKITLKEDIRFGIPSATTVIQGGILKILDRSKEGVDVDLTIRNKSGSIVSRLPAKLHTPYDFFPGQPVPKEHFKARVVFEVGEIVIRTFTHQLTVNVSFLKAPEIASLEKHSMIWRLAQIIDRAPEEGCTIEFQQKGKLPAKFPFKSLENVRFDNTVIKIAETIDNVSFVARYFDVDLNCEVALIDLLNQAGLFRQIRAVCDPKIGIEVIEGALLDDIDADIKEAAIIFMKKLLLGGLTINIVVGLVGSLELVTSNGGHKTFKMAQPKQKYLEHSESLGEMDDIDALLTRAEKVFEDEGYIVIRLNGRFDEPF